MSGDRAKRSGITVTPENVPIILGMVARGDRRHDVAAWLGLNQGRIKEVEDGKHGSGTPAPHDQLPPSGSPGPKALELRDAVEQVRHLLRRQGPGDIATALKQLELAITTFDGNE